MFAVITPALAFGSAAERTSVLIELYGVNISFLRSELKNRY